MRYVKDLLEEPKKLSLAEFGAATKDFFKDKKAPEDKDLPLIPRDVPKHEVALLGGCSAGDYELIEKQIVKAIEVGAPLYNKKEFSASLHIYEGTLVDLQRKLSAGCKGPKQALTEGQQKMQARKTDAEKVWALRDAFDGLIDVVKRLKAQPRTQ